MNKTVSTIVVLGVGFLIGHLTRHAPVSAQPTPCDNERFYSADYDDDGKVCGSVADAIGLLKWCFLGDAPPQVCFEQDFTRLEEDLARCEAELQRCSEQLVACKDLPNSFEEELQRCGEQLAACKELPNSCQAELHACQSSKAQLPDTGQTTCIDDGGNVVDCTVATCPGQDGNYASGCPSEDRFKDNGDGTVTDTCTGLMWQKDSGINGDVITWCAALGYCENLELGGHDDWRLPNVRELQSLVDYGRGNPSINPVFDVLATAYWTSTFGAAVPEGAWIVRFSGGIVGFVGRDFLCHVRAVRSVP